MTVIDRLGLLARYGQEECVRAIDVMTRHIVTATPQMTVHDAARLMINHRISGLPVIDGEGRLVGMVTEGDLLRRAETATARPHSGWSAWFSPASRLAADYIKSHARRLADIMTNEVVSVGQLATLGEIAELMETRRIKRVPVVHEGRLVGIVSRADFLRILASGAPSATREEQDRSIHSRLAAELNRQKWAQSGELDIVVSDGIVHLWGVVGSEQERKALCIAAENTPGVRGVEDHTISGPLRPGPLFPVI